MYVRWVEYKTTCAVGPITFEGGGTYRLKSIRLLERPGPCGSNGIPHYGVTTVISIGRLTDRFGVDLSKSTYPATYPDRIGSAGANLSNLSIMPHNQANNLLRAKTLGQSSGIWISFRSHRRLASARVGDSRWRITRLVYVVAYQHTSLECT